MQDNWRVTKPLTLDYGIRFYWIQPQYDAAHQTSAFNPSLYDPAKGGVLRLPNANGSLAVDPLTGATGPKALIGSLVNNGQGYVNGLYANGMGQSGKN